MSVYVHPQPKPLDGVLKPPWFAGNRPLAPVPAYTFDATPGLPNTDDNLHFGMLITQGTATGDMDWDYVRWTHAGAFPVTLVTGDANNDRAVTADDLIAVQQNFGTVEPNVPPDPPSGTHVGDADDNGTVTADDLISVQQNFGNTMGPSGLAVPEPGTITVLLAGLATLRRRDQHAD